MKTLLSRFCLVGTLYQFIPGIILLFIIFSPTKSLATHLRAGQITASQVGCSGTFVITITVFTDTESGIQFGGDYLYFGDGGSVFVEDRPSQPIKDVPHLGIAQFTVTHTYSSQSSSYIISYGEDFRNDHILNIDNSVKTRFYLETKIILDPFLNSPELGCNSSPILSVPPIDDGCTGVAFSHNPGAYDIDGDSLSYELVIPMKGRSLLVDNYRLPDAPEFYASLDYAHASEDKSQKPMISIGPVTGTILWNAPGAVGEYNIAFVVKEWRKKSGVWYPLGFVRRDMQIIISDCLNNRPQLVIPQDTCVVAGEALSAVIKGMDVDHDQVKIEAFSEVFALAKDSAYYSPHGFQSSDPEATLNLFWETTCAHVKEQPYQVVFKISDKTTNGPSLVTYETWRIKVIAPKPLWSSAQVDLAQCHAKLEWQPYACSNDVQHVKIQIWRKVAGFEFDPDRCETGIPGYLGYDLIATVSAESTSFVDTNNGSGLAVGAQYCYRLVAVFPLPRGGESYVSDEICVDPILADAPVITNVSIDRTGIQDGAITIKWLRPFNIDTVQFPPPYSYVVQRAETQSGPFASVVHVGKIDKESVQDSGLNTEDKAFYYRVLLYVPKVSSDFPVDTSAVASTVRLTIIPQDQKFNLAWNASVPWSSIIITSPLHDIFRSENEATENADMIFYKPVNVVEDGQRFIDNTQLDENTIYCYQVATRGGYGNPEIEEPLVNYSQIACAQLKEVVPVCTFKVVVDPVDCDKFLNEPCDFKSFQNVIHWNVITCKNIKSYNLYASDNKSGIYFLIKSNIIDTFYIDKNLDSYARCYRITAVDRFGNESEQSEPACNDNCPYYELPNLFTPNDDQFNDLFSAFNVRGMTQPPAELVRKCARFVEKVKLHIYNRWGKEVYSFESGGERSIYIDWNGHDKNGKELASAVYYYVAEVNFQTIDPSKRVRLLKGWVQLVR